MIRVALLLLIVAALVIFAAQNLTPMPLVILGFRITLPLAAWVLGAMAAGAVTNLLLFGFSSLSRSASRQTQPRATRSPWSSASSRNAGPTSRSRTAGFSGGSRPSGDDWETNARDEWDEWAQEPPPPRSTASSAPRTEIRDTTDEDWAKWEGYEQRPPRDAVRQSPHQPVDPSMPPRRTDFEAPQAPKTQQQTGSVYSYSYREPQDTPPRKPSETRKNEIYDAEYRVIIPPYNPTTPAPAPPPPPPPAATDDDDDDWGLDDDLSEKPKP